MNKPTLSKTIIFLALAAGLSLPAFATPAKPAKPQIVRITYPAATPTTVAIWLFSSV